MALRLRRGTDAERQLITPAQGELIYTTDTKSLYIGDGTTAGGIVVQGGGGGGASTLNDLTDVTIGSVSDGQILNYDSSASAWVPSNLASISFGKLNQHTDVLYPDQIPSPPFILLTRLRGSEKGFPPLADARVRPLQNFIDDSSIWQNFINTISCSNVSVEPFSHSLLCVVL